MMHKTTRFALTIVGCCLLLAGPFRVFGGEFNEKVNIGDVAPSWKALEGVDGEKHSLSDIKDAPTVLVVFVSYKCPIALAYDDRLVALAKKFGPKKMAVVAINSNNKEILDKMKGQAEKKGYPFPYLRDADQQMARQFGATCTPHAFLLDKDRKIVYMGAIDDNKNTEKVKKDYLRGAIKSVLAGTAVAEPETRQFGCGIKWAR